MNGGGSELTAFRLRKRFLVFSTFHLHESVFVFYESFPHLLCRFSVSRSPEHVVIVCILLLSVSDFPKDSQFRLPKWRMCEVMNFVFDACFRILYMHIHA